MKHMITAVAMMLAVAGVAAAQSGDERSWEGSIGAGAAFGPVFLGSDETDVTGLPMLEIRSKDDT